MIKNTMRLVRDKFTPIYPKIKDYPKSISLVINSNCNLKCIMCDVGQRNQSGNFYKSMIKNDEISLDKIKEIAEEIKGKNVKIHINGLEPLLHKDIGKIIKEFTTRNIYCTLTTNGYLLRKRADEILDSGLNEISISIDGPAEIHNKIRGVPDSYERSIEGIQYIIANRFKKLRVRCAMCVSMYNEKKLFDTVAELKKLNINSLTIAHLNYITEEMCNLHNQRFNNVFKKMTPSSTAAINPLDVDPNEVYSQYRRIKREFGSFVHFLPEINKEEIFSYYQTPLKPVFSNKCLSPWTHMQILSNGDVIPASRCFSVPLGSIYKNNIKEIWTCKEFSDFREKIKKHGFTPVCTRCCALFSRRLI